MAANLRHSCRYFCFPMQFSRYFSYKNIANYSKGDGRRLSSLLSSHQCVSLMQSTSFNASKLTAKLRFLHVSPDLRAASEESSGYNDPEFVTEEFAIPVDNVKDIGNMVNSIKDKAGVLMKTIKENDDEKGLKILIGGTRQEVQKAVFYLKSSVAQDSANQRLVLLQDDKIDQPYSTKKEKPIWSYYRRNFKGQKPPMRGKGELQLVSGNPCPICRLYLAGGYKLDYKDVDLLSQFISPHNGEVFEASKTGVCTYQQDNLKSVIQTAKDYGLLSYSIPGPRTIRRPIKQAKIPVNVRLK